MLFGKKVNKVKKLWCYLFYFTWKLHVILGRYLNAPMERLFNLFAIFKKHQKSTKKTHERIMNDQAIGYNIYFAYKCMLTTTSLIVASVEICFFYFLDTNLTEVLNFISGINLDKRVNFIAFFISALVISNCINKFLLDWDNNGYIEFFNKFRTMKNKINGFLFVVGFHLGSILICIFWICYFNI